MSHYPAGSMKGSGIYATTSTITLLCGARLRMPESVPPRQHSAAAIGCHEGWCKACEIEETWADAHEEACEFDGPVDVVWNDWGTHGSANCPSCGTEHEIEAPDPSDEEPPERDDHPLEREDW